MIRKPNTARRWHAVAGIAALLCGLVFYAIARQAQPIVHLPYLVFSSFPSFIHMLALTSLAFAMRLDRSHFAISSILLVFVATVLSERFVGYFDILDLAAATVGLIT